MCVLVCASLANLQIESVLLRLGSNFVSQKRLGERHEVEGQKEKDKNNKERISSSLKQIDNPDQSLMELEGKDQMLLCVCVCFYYPFHQQSWAVRCKTLSFILNEREEKMMENSACAQVLLHQMEFLWSRWRQMQTLVDAYCDAFTDHSACCNSSRSIKLILK